MRHPEGGAPLALALLVLVLVLVACGDHPSGEATQQEPAPRIEPVERIRIDGEEHALTAIRRAALRSDGLLAVDQRLDETVLFFSPTGEKVGEFGRRGEGPGEFTTINGMGWTGDTLWVSDGPAGRLTRITGLPDDPHIAAEVRTSGFRRSDPVRVSGRDIPSFGSVRVRAVYPGGDLLAEMTLADAPDGSEYANTALYVRSSEDGTVEQVLATVDRPPEEVRVLWTSEARLAFGAPWVLQPSVAVSEDAGRIAVVTPIVEEGTPIRTFEATMLSGSGDTLYTRRHPFDATPIPDAVADSAIDARVESMERYETLFPDVDLVAIYRRDVVVPPIFPPIGTALVGSEGRLWIQRLEAGRSGTGSYLVLDEEGDLVGEVMLRAGVRAVAGDSVWRVVASQLGVPIPIRYHVPWPERRGSGPAAIQSAAARALEGI